MYKITDEKLKEWLRSRNATPLWSLHNSTACRGQGFDLTGYTVSGHIIIIQRFYEDGELVGLDAYVPASSSIDAETELLSIDGHLEHLDDQGGK